MNVIEIQTIAESQIKTKYSAWSLYSLFQWLLRKNHLGKPAQYFIGQLYFSPIFGARANVCTNLESGCKDRVRGMEAKSRPLLFVPSIDGNCDHLFFMRIPALHIMHTSSFSADIAGFAYSCFYLRAVQWRTQLIFNINEKLFHFSLDYFLLARQLINGRVYWCIHICQLYSQNSFKT